MEVAPLDGSTSDASIDARPPRGAQCKIFATFPDLVPDVVLTARR
jgi:hypothetical protein